MTDRPNPQRKTIDLGDLSEVVLTSVRRVLEEQPTGPVSEAFQHPRIICGWIFEPAAAKSL
jgi:hypothetical protein